jgi:hypothetical protein
MPAVAIRSTVLTSTNIKWVKPQPLWAFEDTDMSRPWLAQFKDDRFLPSFLDLMAGKVVGQTPADLHQTVPDKTDIDGKGTMQLKLYQPLHQRYYLVTGSLICRQFGMPDRTVVRKNGEKTSFVLRRTVKDAQGNPVEQGWVNDGPNKGWQPLKDEQKRLVLIRKDEQRLPLHPVKVGMINQAPTNIQRKVYYGYIPVDGREKYLMQRDDTAQAIQDAIDHPPAGGPISDPRIDQVRTQVFEPWRGLYVDSKGNKLDSQHTPGTDAQRLISLYLIVDLGDFLKNNLPSVLDAVTNDRTNLPDNQQHTNAHRQALLDELNKIFLDATSGQIKLAAAIKDLQDSSKLAQAEADSPTLTYNVYDAIREYAIADLPAGKFIDPYHGDHQDAPTIPPPTDGVYRVHVRATHQNGAETKVYYLADDGPFHKLVQDALDEEKTEKKSNNKQWLNVPPEVEDMIKNDPPDGDVYYLRLVYEYGDGCVVLSDLSEGFTFARPFDPDAPARHIRIELPSIKPKDLRKFKRGVGMQSSCELNKLTNLLSLDNVMNGNISAQTCTSVELAMICSFSIPIITLVAFIVMFIFLVLLNIIFWWLPFIRICFPVPKPSRVGA